MIVAACFCVLALGKLEAGAPPADDLRGLLALLDEIDRSDMCFRTTYRAAVYNFAPENAIKDDSDQPKRELRFVWEHCAHHDYIERRTLTDEITLKTYWDGKDTRRQNVGDTALVLDGKRPSDIETDCADLFTQSFQSTFIGKKPLSRALANATLVGHDIDNTSERWRLHLGGGATEIEVELSTDAPRRLISLRSTVKAQPDAPPTASITFKVLEWEELEGMMLPRTALREGHVSPDAARAIGQSKALVHRIRFIRESFQLLDVAPDMAVMTAPSIIDSRLQIVIEPEKRRVQMDGGQFNFNTPITLESLLKLELSSLRSLAPIYVGESEGVRDVETTSESSPRQYWLYLTLFLLFVIAGILFLLQRRREAILILCRSRRFGCCPCVGNHCTENIWSVKRSQWQKYLPALGRVEIRFWRIHVSRNND